jgi:hypothetical protein
LRRDRLTLCGTNHAEYVAVAHAADCELDAILWLFFWLLRQARVIKIGTPPGRRLLKITFACTLVMTITESQEVCN